MPPERIFLSHSSSDKPVVEKTKEYLESKGFSCWLDREQIDPGQSFPGRINDGLGESLTLLLFISENSLKSRWVTREIEAALASANTDIIPIRLDDSEIPPLLAPLQYVDFRGEDVAQNLGVLASALEKLSSRRPHASLPRFRLCGRSDDFRLVIFSGVSAAGKDSILAILEETLTQDFSVEVLTKFTTRPKRIYESPYSRPVSEDEFDQLRDGGKLVYDYKKRKARYGFDVQQLQRCILEGDILLSVFTHFRLVPEVTASLREQGLTVVPIFIDVSKYHLERRTTIRFLEDHDRAVRTWSIRNDFRAIEGRKTFRDEYTFIKNGDDRGIEDAANEVEKIIRDSMD